MTLKEMIETIFSPIINANKNVSVIKMVGIDDRKLELYATCRVREDKTQKIFAIKDMTFAKTRTSERYPGRRTFAPLSADRVISEDYGTFLPAVDKTFGLDSIVNEPVKKTEFTRKKGRKAA